MESLKVSDKQAAEVAKTPNRITLEDMLMEIEQEEYIYPDVAEHFTICILKLRNGFIVTGESAPMDPENFNKDLGKKFAKESAVRKLWPLFAFSGLDGDFYRG